MDFKDLGPAYKLIFASARLRPTADDILLMDQSASLIHDWDYFTNQAVRSGLGPLVHKNLPLLKIYDVIPREAKTKLQQIYYRSLTRNMMIYEHFRKAVKAFNEKGISVIALKGVYLADTLYQDIGLRQMSDIDLLVRDEDTESCCHILHGFGYRQSQNYFNSEIFRWLFTPKHIPQMVLNGVAFEIHSKIHASNRGYHIKINDLFRRSRPTVINSTHCLSLSADDLVLHLCIHLFEHLPQPQFQLYRFCDIAEVLRNCGHELDWTEIKRRCDLYRCTSQVFSILSLARIYFNAPVPIDIPDGSAIHGFQKAHRRFLDRLEQKHKYVIPQGLALTIHGLETSQGVKREMKIVFGLVFPGLAFMKARYGVKHSINALPFYLLRVNKGLQYLTKSIKNRIFSAR